MITVKLVGGARKSFPTEVLEMDSGITIKQLADMLPGMSPDGFPELDTDNILIAVNGADSSALDGRSTVLRDGDVISIIPVIHGGAPKRLGYRIGSRDILAVQIGGKREIDVGFLDGLRSRFPRVVLQAISAKFVLNGSHLKKILSLSLESQKDGILLSNRLETDILMRFAISGQISSAIASAGLRPGSDFVLVAIGTKSALDTLYGEVSPLAVRPFPKSSEAFLRRHAGITRRHLDSVHSKTPLEDILAEKAAVLL